MSGFGGFGTGAQGGLFAANKTGTGFGTSFGAPATTTTTTFGTSNFGAAAGTGTGLFGATQPATGFQFGAPAATAATTTTTTGFGFGTQPLNFGATTANAPAFGATTTNAPAFGATTTTTLNFGVPKTTAPTSLSFGLGTSAPALGTSFGLTSTPATQAPGFSFGATTQPATGFGFGAKPFAAATTTAAPTSRPYSFPLGSSLLFGAKSDAPGGATTTITTASIGLGGVDTSQAKSGLAGGGTAEPLHAKDNLLPDPVMQTLTDMQNYMRQQKSISVEISHASSKPLKKVQEDTEALESLLATLQSGLTRNAIAVDRLKTETAQGLHQAEMAQRTQELPAGLEYDSSASFEYFDDLVTRFEGDTIRFRVQMEAAEKHLRSLTEQACSVSPQELTLAMRRLHETLVVLAARVQTLHTTVESEKDQYRNLRRVYLKDDSAVFRREAEDLGPSRKHANYSLRSLTGPTPFSGTPAGGAPLHRDALAVLTSVTAFGAATSAPASWMSTPQSTSGMAMSSVLPTPQLSEAAGFPLAKPPAGNKRSKR